VRGVADDQPAWTRRRLLLLAVALAVVVAVLAPSVGPALLRAWQGRARLRAAGGRLAVRRAARGAPASPQRRGGPSRRSRGRLPGAVVVLDQVTQRRHVRPDLLLRAVRRSLEDQRRLRRVAPARPQRPADATEANLEGYAYDEGHVVSEEQGGRSRVELLVRGRNVLVRVSYLGALPLASATSATQAVADTMLEEVEDLNFPIG
jgi:hypothetical protein